MFAQNYALVPVCFVVTLKTFQVKFEDWRLWIAIIQIFLKHCTIYVLQHEQRTERKLHVILKFPSKYPPYLKSIMFDFHKTSSNNMFHGSVKINMSKLKVSS